MAAAARASRQATHRVPSSRTLWKTSPNIRLYYTSTPTPGVLRPNVQPSPKKASHRPNANESNFAFHPPIRQPSVDDFPFKEHPQRIHFTHELHARPWAPLRLPCQVTHLTFLTGEDPEAHARDIKHLQALCYLYNLPPPSSLDDLPFSSPSTTSTPSSSFVPIPLSQYQASFGPFSLKWERHTEFTTYTFYSETSSSSNPVEKSDLQLGISEWVPFLPLFDPPVISRVPETWKSAIPGECLVAMNLHVISQPPLESAVSDDDASRQEPNRLFAKHLRSLFHFHPILHAQLHGGSIDFYSDFRIHRHGYFQAVISVDSTPKGNSLEVNGRNDVSWSVNENASRIVQKLTEVETYRTLAMLALPMAREISPQIQMINARLLDVTNRLAQSTKVDDKRDLLRELFELASRVKNLKSRSDNRFDAMIAYQAIADKRLKDLGEVAEVTSGVKPLETLIRKRLSPAMFRSKSVQTRLEKLLSAVMEVASLLQSSVNVEIEKQNQKVLDEMNRRSLVQLRLQQAVEGLSVVAMSYYALGLVSHLAKGLHAAHLLPTNLPAEFATAVSIPFVVAGVFLTVGATRRRLVRYFEGEKTKKGNHKKAKSEES